MRHGKHTFKIGRTGAHRRSMVANLLKSLIEADKIVTTTVKAKELRRHADRMITLAKRNTLASRRAVVSKLRLTYNTLSPKEQRLVKGGNKEPFSRDRLVMGKLFGELRERFVSRNGGYTRVVRLADRVGDSASTSIIEYLK